MPGPARQRRRPPGGDRARPTQRRPPSARASTPSPGAAARRRTPRSAAHDRAAPSRRALPIAVDQVGPDVATGWSSPAQPLDIDDRAAQPLRAAPDRGRPSYRAVVSDRAASSWSRSTASRIASRAMTAASCATAPRRSSWRSRCRSGDEVEAGDVIAVVESMKMETSFVAPFRGPGDARCSPRPTCTSTPHAPILRLESLEDDARRLRRRRAASTSAGWRASRASEVPARCHDNLLRLERLMLGYDIHADEVAADRRGPPRRLLRPACLRPGADPRRASPARDLRRPGRPDPAPARGGRPCRGAAAQPAGAPERLPAVARRRGRGIARTVRGAARAGRSPTTASRASTARPSSRPPATASTSPSSAPGPPAPPCWPSSTAGSSRPTSSRATSAKTSATRWSAWPRRPRAGTR